MAQEIQLVVFRLASAEYGVPIHQVQEINRLTDITKLPQTPWFMEGVINLRGKVIPVVDLRKRFGLSVTNTDETRIIIVEVESHTVGVIVDDVAEVLRLSTDEIEPPPANFIMDAAYMQGLGKVDNRLVILLHIDKILTSKEEEILKALPA
jgi:purine-binding chemotaxis protein CheW